MPGGPLAMSRTPIDQALPEWLSDLLAQAATNPASAMGGPLMMAGKGPSLLRAGGKDLSEWLGDLLRVNVKGRMRTPWGMNQKKELRVVTTDPKIDRVRMYEPRGGGRAYDATTTDFDRMLQEGMLEPSGPPNRTVPSLVRRLQESLDQPPTPPGHEFVPVGSEPPYRPPARRDPREIGYERVREREAGKARGGTKGGPTRKPFERR